MPENVVFETFDLEGFPLFNQDLEGEPPEIVRSFKAEIRRADALLIATPEYNYSVPGVLKNVIDWASRPVKDNVFDGKCVGLMGVSTGMFGTARAQCHLRQCFVFLNVHTVNKPEVMIGHALEKFDAQGNLKDQRAKDLVSQLIKSLIDLTVTFGVRSS
jgi:chromate reductase